MKKLLIAIFIIMSLGFTFGEKIDTKTCKPQKFIVSGYYSPVKGQKYYYKGNYEDEVTLNGYGYKGASGKKVFNGMLAAPKTYKFGTVINFPGYGIGEVSDRGGAIVKAGQRGNSYDRIDIWMGTGEAGLKRALSFGKKEVSAYVCDTIKQDIGFDYSKFKIIDNFFEISLWTISLEAGRSDPWVEVMQNYFHRLGYLDKKEITGKFSDKTEKAVCKYQLDKGLVDADDDLCGYFGPLTRKTLRNTVANKGIKVVYNDTDYPTQSQDNTENTVDEGLTDDAFDDNIEEEVVEGDITDEELKNKLYKADVDTSNIINNTGSNNSTGNNDSISFQRPFLSGEKSDDINNLQLTLSGLGYLSGNITGTYDWQTMQAIYQFQLDNHLIDQKDIAAGYFGPKTREKLNQMTQ